MKMIQENGETKIDYEMRGNLKFCDMSDGNTLSIDMQDYYINRVIDKLNEGKPHWSIRTGNFLVIGMTYDCEYQIFITEAYKDATIYKREGDPPIERAMAY